MSIRFEIEQETDSGPTKIVDNATDPDSEDHGIVTISQDYGTPESRKFLVEHIKELLEQMADHNDGIPPALSITGTVQTYNGETGKTGHGKPLHEVKLSFGQGVTITLPDMGHGNPDIYIERQPGKWRVNVSPEQDEIKACIDINDDGSSVVWGYTETVEVLAEYPATAVEA